mgnify:CR=1 FL=1
MNRENKKKKKNVWNEESKKNFVEWKKWRRKQFEIIIRQKKKNSKGFEPWGGVVGEEGERGGKEGEGGNEREKENLIN